MKEKNKFFNIAALGLLSFAFLTACTSSGQKEPVLPIPAVTATAFVPEQQSNQQIYPTATPIPIMPTSVVIENPISTDNSLPTSTPEFISSPYGPKPYWYQGGEIGSDFWQDQKNKIPDTLIFSLQNIEKFKLLANQIPEILSQIENILKSLVQIEIGGKTCVGLVIDSDEFTVRIVTAGHCFKQDGDINKPTLQYDPSTIRLHSWNGMKASDGTSIQPVSGFGSYVVEDYKNPAGQIEDFQMINLTYRQASISNGTNYSATWIQPLPIDQITTYNLGDNVTQKCVLGINPVIDHAAFTSCFNSTFVTNRSKYPNEVLAILEPDHYVMNGFSGSPIFEFRNGKVYFSGVTVTNNNWTWEIASDQGKSDPNFANPLRFGFIPVDNDKINWINQVLSKYRAISESYRNAGTEIQEDGTGKGTGVILPKMNNLRREMILRGIMQGWAKKK